MTPARIPHVDRSVDDAVLRWLGMLARGMTPVQVARAEGVPPIQVNNACRRVRAADIADIAESGEPAGLVRRAYW